MLDIRLDHPIACWSMRFYQVQDESLVTATLGRVTTRMCAARAVMTAMFHTAGCKFTAQHQIEYTSNIQTNSIQHLHQQLME